MSGARVAVKLVFADNGSFHDVIVYLPADALAPRAALVSIVCIAILPACPSREIVACLLGTYHYIKRTYAVLSQQGGLEGCKPSKCLSFRRRRGSC